MATIKSYTDLEQSKKLAEILSIESADACWTNHLFADILSSWRLESTPPQKYKSTLDRYVVKGYLIEPAWSLVALLSIIPKEIFHGDYVINITVRLNNLNNKWIISYNKDKTDSFPIYKLIASADNLFDACVTMIEKLNELKML